MGEAQSDRRVKDSMNNLELYERVRAVPDDAKKPINAGRLKGMTDINPMWRIKKLTEEFGPCGFGWYYETINKWIETAGDECCAFADIRLYVKIGDEWSKPIYGTGGSKLAAKERGGIYVSDECYKMATTDALSVACKQLGIGADVYFAADHTKYDKGKTQEPKKTIGESDINIMRDYFKKNGLSEDKVMKKYKVKSINDVTQGQYIAIVNPNNLPYFKQECSLEN